MFDILTPAIANSLGYGDFSKFQNAPMPALFEIITLNYLPSDFEILPLYFLLFLFLPLAFWSAVRSSISMLLISLAVYIGVQIFPDTIRLPEPWVRIWLFNPLAWQLIFFLGMAIGCDERLRRWVIPRHFMAVMVAFIILEAAFFAKLLSPNSAASFTHKDNCGPLRLVHLSGLCPRIKIARGKVSTDRLAPRLWRTRQRQCSAS